jgi:predicted glycosyltransferase involved in capsule biosynthesis
MLWQRSFLLRLGGFDARFDGAEDTQLVFRAMQAGGRLGHSDVPKQCYFTREIKCTYEPQHIYSHRRLFEYILRESDDVASKQYAHFWLGKESVYEFLLSWGLLWKNRSSIWRYTKSRLRIFG